MVTKWIPITEVYDKVTSDLTFPSSYKNSILTWIGECTETMLIKDVLTIQIEKTSVVDFKTQLPCGVVNIVAVYSGGKRLHHTNSVNGRLSTVDRTVDSSSINVWQTVIPLATVINMNTPLPLPYYIQTLELLKSYTLNDSCQYGVDYYKQNGNCLQFSFEERDNVEIFYEGVLKNEDGDILVPDNIFYLEAIVYWVEHKLIRKGVIKQNSINNDALNQYYINKNKAIINISFPSPEKMQTIADKQGLFSYDLYTDSLI